MANRSPKGVCGTLVSKCLEAQDDEKKLTTEEYLTRLIASRNAKG